MATAAPGTACFSDVMTCPWMPPAASERGAMASRLLPSRLLTRPPSPPAVVPRAGISVAGPPNEPGEIRRREPSDDPITHLLLWLGAFKTLPAPPRSRYSGRHRV